MKVQLLSNTGTGFPAAQILSGKKNSSKGYGLKNPSICYIIYV